MNFFRKTANASEVYVDGFDKPDDTTVETVMPETPVRREDAMPRHTAGNLEMTVITPTDFSDVTSVASAIMHGTTVVLNLDRVNKEASRRMLDFIGGVVFSIDGGIKKVAATTYVVTPRNVDVYDSARSLNLEAGENNRENIGDFNN